ncbi:MAG: ABC transporter permease [Bacillota bacterium]
MKTKKFFMYWQPYIICFALLILWQTVSSLGIVPKFMLPAPSDVVKAFCSDFSLIMSHTKVTLIEAVLGLSVAILLSLLMAILMDRNKMIYRSLYPLIIVSQTIPTIAIAPLLVLWFGYEMLPKVILIVVTCFFPMTIGLLNGLAAVDSDVIHLMKSMGATESQIYKHVKLPTTLSYFFAGLRISVSYSIIGAVISEWLGGVEGLGVYMIRVKKSYNFDKMFAVIFLISIISLLLMQLVNILQKKVMPWEEKTN